MTFVAKTIVSECGLVNSKNIIVQPSGHSVLAMNSKHCGSSLVITQAILFDL